MTEEELKEMFLDAITPLLKDKRAQKDEEIIDFYLEVFCLIAKEYAECTNTEQKS